ncbi:hypothetical protein ACOSP7_002611 [Xanthoceras sorbifolium]
MKQKKSPPQFIESHTVNEAGQTEVQQLRREYDPVEVLVSSHQRTISLEEAQLLLLMHEQRGEYNAGGKMQANYHQTSSAYFASSESVNDASWYVDSRATNHVTANLKNLAVSTEYRGKDKLIVGDAFVSANNTCKLDCTSHKSMNKNSDVTTPTSKYVYNADFVSKMNFSMWHCQTWASCPFDS